VIKYTKLFGLNAKCWVTLENGYYKSFQKYQNCSINATDIIIQSCRIQTFKSESQLNTANIFQETIHQI
jgi:hypothetical protein